MQTKHYTFFGEVLKSRSKPVGFSGSLFETASSLLGGIIKSDKLRLNYISAEIEW
jgi:hypothetical protein